MASPTAFALILLALTPCLLTIPQVEAATAKAKAPAPAPAGRINLTAILDKSGQYTTFIRLLNVTQVGNQIENQLNSSDQGMTILAPTDNAFNNLKAGTLNDLSSQQQVDLVLYHVLSKYYSLVMFQTVSNPVRTQASGQEGEQYGLNITSSANQVNVSAGSISTQINNALREDFPLAVYQLDKVLLPEDHFVSKTKVSPPPAASPPSKKKSPVASAKAPASADADTNSSSKGRNLGLGVIVGICLMCLGMI